MLTVLGIIQGLALNQLADKMMRGSYADALPGNRWLWLHFALCMLILIRVFQTYLLAALDYTGWRTSFHDALFIFAAGLLQYWVFDALEQSAAAPQELHLRAGTLVALASAIHFFALLRIWFGSELTDKSADHRRREIWLQILEHRACRALCGIVLGRDIAAGDDAAKRAAFGGRSRHHRAQHLGVAAHDDRSRRHVNGVMPPPPHRSGGIPAKHVRQPERHRRSAPFQPQPGAAGKI
jgi:hypothetical protein